MTPTGDGGKPICYGDDSYIKDDIYNPIVWIDKEPYRPRVETLVIKGNSQVFLRLYNKKKNNNWYTLPGGSIDADSSKIEQAKNETNEEALIEITDIYYTGIQYYGRYDSGYRRNHPESEFEYAGTINDVYVAKYAGRFDKSKVEPKDLDPDIAENGKFYYIPDVLPKLSYEHKRALLTCDFLSTWIKNMILMSISDAQVAESMNPNFNNVPPPGDFIYHGSKYKIDVFHPMSIDFGNANQEPGWSTFCFDNFTMALRFAIMRIFQSKVSGKGLEKCEWSFKHDKPYLYRCMWNKLVPLVLGETCYVYQISTKGLDIGIGNDIRFPEYTFREDYVIPERTTEIVLDKAIIAAHVEDMDLITAGAYEEKISKYDIFKNRHYACFINHDYSNDPAIKQIVDDIAKKKLQPGDDVVKYMKENDLIPENLNWNRYMESLDNRNDIMESYNGHLCFYTLVPKDSFGDNLMTLGYMYDRRLYALFDEATDKYRERICYDWKYYDKKPEELTREEIIDALKRFRKVDNLYQIYCFRYPPNVDMGPHMASILQDKVIYKIDIDEPKVDIFIQHIYWGRDGSRPNGKLLNRRYYERVTKEEYFSKYKDSDKMNFASLNHVAITLRGGYIPFSFLTMVDNPMMESQYREGDIIYQDFEKFTSGEINYCLVTGYSGSGKTTFSKSLCKKYKAYLIELDVFMFAGTKKFNDPNFIIHDRNYPYMDYLESRPDIYKIAKASDKTAWINKIGTRTEILKYLNFVFAWCAKQSKNRYVIEGTQILYCDANTVSGKPIVIVDRSIARACIQRFGREVTDFDSFWREVLKTPLVVNYYSYYYKEMKQFKKNVLESFVDIDEIPRTNGEKYYGVPDNEPESDDKRGEYDKFVVNQFKHIDTEYLGATDWEDSISKYIKKKNYDLGLYYVYGNKCGYPVYLGEILVNSDGSWCWYNESHLMEADVNMEDPEDFLYETFREIKDWDHGYVHKGKVITDTDDEDFIMLYRTLSYEDMKNYHVGTCFDYTNYIYTEMVTRYINSDDVDIICYYIEANDENGKNRFCHAFPIVKIKTTGYYYIIEAAWKKFAGIYKNKDINKLIKFYHDKFLNEYNATSCKMFTEYVPKKELEGISCFVFMNTICKNGTMIEV